MLFAPLFSETVYSERKQEDGTGLLSRFPADKEEDHAHLLTAAQPPPLTGTLSRQLHVPACQFSCQDPFFSKPGVLPSCPSPKGSSHALETPQGMEEEATRSHYCRPQNLMHAHIFCSTPPKQAGRQRLKHIQRTEVFQYLITENSRRVGRKPGRFPTKTLPL